MLNSKKLVKVIEMIARRTWRLLNSIIQNLLRWLSRRLFRLGRRRHLANSGFVLPTVAMVTLVVVLLSAALVTRSFDRSRNASNYRVNQENLNAALPALDRARAKINALLDDPELPRGTPSDISLAQVFSKNDFDLPDEQRLLLAFDADDDNNIQSPNGEEINFERSETNIDAWRFPVDTDNNGKFDSFTLYSILFRTPTFDGGAQDRERNPLDARALPAASEVEEPLCQALGSAQLVGSSDWAKVGSQLKKSFFIYVATVPITDAEALNLPNGDDDPYENYLGNQGFSSLEYQTDIARIPLTNNAVVYEDDLVISPGQPFNLNGRVFTNSNLFVFAPENDIELRQVSSPDSCFYEAENAKIIVGGNVAYGRANETVNGGNNIDVHLFKGQGEQPDLGVRIARNDRFVTQDSDEIAYNTFAYEERIDDNDADDGNDSLVELVLAQNGAQQVTGNFPNFRVTSDDPSVVRNAVQARLNDRVNGQGLDPDAVRREELESYIRERTRRVPFEEVAFGGNETKNIGLLGDGDIVRPSNDIAFPFDPNDGITENNFGEVALRTTGNTMVPQATAFQTLEDTVVEEFLGDRLLIGNNLPAAWFDNGTFVGEEGTQDIEDIIWDAPDGDVPRSRKTRVTPLDDLGDIDRDGFWEESAAIKPENKLDGVGGLRVVTGAGFYYPDDNTDILPTPLSSIYSPSVSPLPKNIVWSDSMPVPDVNFLSSGLRVDLDTNNDGISDGDNTNFVMDPPELRGDGDVNDDRPYLKMRATAVYHYRNADDDEEAAREPIACVSTFYDPTNQERSANVFNNNAATLTAAFNGNTARSFNGIVYNPPNFTPARMQDLHIQAAMRHPNGRVVNPVLYSAMRSMSVNGRTIDEITLAEKSAVDAALCSMQIYGQLIGDTGTWGSLGPASGFSLPDEAITEIAFLDARQIKAIDGVDPDTTDNIYETDYGLSGVGLATANTTRDLEYNLTSNYDLAIEQRQPLEIRATVIDLDALRSTQAGTTDTLAEPQEYMLPNSGIIYATRDDALPDDSDQNALPNGDDAIVPGNIAIMPDNISPTDLLLDPTRRPNAIMLTNGTRLGRRNALSANTNPFFDHELGLTLVSNLPVYIKADAPGTAVGGSAGGFNPHEDSNGQRQEEFTVEVNNNNFYDRNRDQLNDNFACRTGDDRLGDACAQGDEWRAATVLSDAVTLLSHDFSEGFRNEGGYDSRNSLIDSIQDEDGDGVEDHFNIEQARLRLGFWNNDFAVNGLSSDNNAAFGARYTDADYRNRARDVANSSYFNNFVTPVQRRADRNNQGFNEYLMEVCPKFPISECGPGDWYLDPPNPTDPRDRILTVAELNANFQAGIFPPFFRGTHLSGTTAQAPNSDDIIFGGHPGIERFARRVAFQRNADQSLVLDTGSNLPIVVAINNAGNIEPGIIGRRNNDPNNANALWFRTTNNPAVPWDPGSLDFRADRNLAYEQPNNSQEEWLLPDIVRVPNTSGDFPAAFEDAFAALNGYGYDELPNNIGGTDNPVDYELCVGGSAVQPGVGNCPVDNEIRSALDALKSLDAIASNLEDDIVDPAAGTIVIEVEADPASNFAVRELESGRFFLHSTQDFPLNFIADNNFNPDAAVPPAPRRDITLRLVGNKDSVFVFLPAIAASTIVLDNVTLELDGVDPNNIFWVAERGIVFAGTNTLSGNFIGGRLGSTNSPLMFDDNNTGAGSAGVQVNCVDPGTCITPIPTETTITSGRFLGFSDPASLTGVFAIDAEFFNLDEASTFTPTPALNLGAMTSARNHPRLIPVLNLHYLQALPANRPRDNNRIDISSTNWQPAAAQDTAIFNLVLGTGDVPSRPGFSGSNGGLENLPRFLENWQGVPEVQISGSLFQIGRSGYASAPIRVLDADNTGPGGLFGADQTYPRTFNLPFYFAPFRNWGFDVGLLSQIPDLFTRRFTTDPADPPNEFFREPSRDDPWIQTLLCGKVAEEDNDGNIIEDFGTNRGNAVNNGQRNGCID